MPAGWPATCSSTARSARAPRGCSEPYTDAPGPLRQHLPRRRRDHGAPARLHRGAASPAGFHVIGDAAVSRGRRRPASGSSTRFGGARGRPLRAPARAPGDGDRRAGRPARRVGRHRQRATQLRRAVGRRQPGCTRSVSAPTEAVRLNPLALLASQGVPLAFGSDSPGHRHESVGDGPRGDPTPDTRAARVSARAAFSAATRGAWRAGGVRDGVTGTLVPGAPASYAVWETERVSRSARRPTPCSAGPPTRAPGCPPCRGSVRRPAAALPADRAPGCRSSMAEARATGRATTTPTFPASPTSRCRRRGAMTTHRASPERIAVGRRLASPGGPAAALSAADRRRAAAVRELPAVRLVVHGDRRVRAAGLGADPRVHHARRRVRLRLPVRAGVLHAAAAVDQRTGRAGAVAGAVGRCRRCSRRCSGCSPSRCAGCRAGRSGSPGCGLAQEWLKSTVPFGGFPWGVVGFSQTDGPLLPLAQLGGAPLVSFAVALVGFSLAALAFEIVALVAARQDDRAAPHVGTARGGAAGRLHRRRAADHGAGHAARPRSPVRVPATNRPSTSRPCRATCRGSGWSSTPSGARCSTTTSGETLQLAEDVRAGPGAAAAVRHLAGELLGHRPAGQPGRRGPDLGRPRRRSRRRSWSAAWSPRPATRRTTRCRPTPSSSGIPQTGPGDRHDKQIVQPFGEYLPWRGFFQPPVVLRRPGRLLRARQRHRRGARGRCADRGDDLLGGHLRPRAARVGAQRRPGAGGADQQRHLRRDDERAAAGVRAGCAPSSTTATWSWRAPPGSAPSSRPTGVSWPAPRSSSRPTSTRRSG